MSQSLDYNFEKFESKVNNVMKILQKIAGNSKEEQVRGMIEADKFLGSDDYLCDIDAENFIVKVRDNRTIINKKDPEREDSKNDQNEMDKFTFMQQLEQDAAERNENRKKREDIAQNLRKLGNNAYYDGEFERAINMFSKAIDHIKDSPILYTNRALTYIRLKLYKRAVIDCDFVINKLDEKNLRAWLYRATAYYFLEDEQNFKKCVSTAKKNHSKESEYIEKFIDNVKEGRFNKECN